MFLVLLLVFVVYMYCGGDLRGLTHKNGQFRYAFGLLVALPKVILKE
jgi:hypothetical protein